jgi:hypothetical protein
MLPIDGPTIRQVPGFETAMIPVGSGARLHASLSHEKHMVMVEGDQSTRVKPDVSERGLEPLRPCGH